MDLRRGTHADQAAIRRLLRDNRLPVDDLDAGAVEFIVAADGTELAGVVGLEPFGEVALLRSLAVRGERRGQGFGGRLVEAAERHAAALGARQVVLLTQTAAPFFAGRGYAALARERAPASVQRSAEFRSLCPASATCMTKPLELAP